MSFYTNGFHSCSSRCHSEKYCQPAAMQAIIMTFIISLELKKDEDDDDEEAGLGGFHGFPLNLADNLDTNKVKRPVPFEAARKDTP